VYCIKRDYRLVKILEIIDISPQFSSDVLRLNVSPPQAGSAVILESVLVTCSVRLDNVWTSFTRKDRLSSSVLTDIRINLLKSQIAGFLKGLK
jgi:hypothetical protein